MPDKQYMLSKWEPKTPNFYISAIFLFKMRTGRRNVRSTVLLPECFFLKQQQAFYKEFKTELFFWLCQRREMLSRWYRFSGKTEPAFLSNLLGVFQILFYKTKHQTKTQMAVNLLFISHHLPCLVIVHSLVKTREWTLNSL